MNNESLYLPLIDEHVTFIEARFSPDGMSYTYKCDLPVKVDDIVMVESKGWYAVATVTAIDKPLPIGRPDHIEFRWVIGIMDYEAHVARLNHERDIIARVNTARAGHMRGQLLTALGITPEVAAQLTGETK